MNVGQYLERIGYRGPLDPSLPVLRALHRAHLLSVPFENLDIHLGRPILLDPQALFEKIVLRRRGGFCYELNGLFAGLLRTLGYNVTLLSAEVADPQGAFSPEFDHLALRVDLAEPWLADVGFGESFLEPLRLDDPAEQFDDGRGYRISGTLLDRRDDSGVWKPQCRFSHTPRRLADFEDRCRYHQTSPDSFFRSKCMCTLATPEGRITLTSRHLTTTVGRRTTERPVASEAEFRALLEEHFGIRYGPAPVLQYG